jgi:hypothetical protein
MTFHVARTGWSMTREHLDPGAKRHFPLVLTIIGNDYNKNLKLLKIFVVFTNNTIGQTTINFLHIELQQKQSVIFTKLANGYNKKSICLQTIQKC